MYRVNRNPFYSKVLLQSLSSAETLLQHSKECTYATCNTGRDYENLQIHETSTSFGHLDGQAQFVHNLTTAPPPTFLCPQYLQPFLEVPINFLDQVHLSTGLPWWIVIPSATFSIRLLLTPLSLYQSSVVRTNIFLLREASSMAASQWILEAARRGLGPTSTIPTMWKFSMTMSNFEKLRSKTGSPSPLRALINPLVQIPIFVMLAFTIRTMARSHWPGFEDGGILWFKDLTQVAFDVNRGIAPLGYEGFILPLVVLSLTTISIRRAFRSAATAASKPNTPTTFMSEFMRALPTALYAQAVLNAAVTCSLPQAALLHWVASAAYTLGLQVSLANPRTRSLLGMPDSLQSPVGTIPARPEAPPSTHSDHSASSAQGTEDLNTHGKGGLDQRLDNGEGVSPSYDPSVGNEKAGERTVVTRVSQEDSSSVSVSAYASTSMVAGTRQSDQILDGSRGTEQREGVSSSIHATSSTAASSRETNRSDTITTTWTYDRHLRNEQPDISSTLSVHSSTPQPASNLQPGAESHNMSSTHFSDLHPPSGPPQPAPEHQLGSSSAEHPSAHLSDISSSQHTIDDTSTLESKRRPTQSTTISDPQPSTGTQTSTLPNIASTASPSSTTAATSMSQPQTSSFLPAALASKLSLIDDPDVLTVMGATLSSQQMYEQALVCLDKAVAMNPQHTRAHYARGQVFSMTKRWPEAEVAYRAAAESAAAAVASGVEAARAELGQSLYCVATALHTQGKLNEAVDAYAKALPLWSGMAVLHMSLANALIALGRTVEAKAVVEAGRRVDASSGHPFWAAFDDLERQLKA